MCYFIKYAAVKPLKANRGKSQSSPTNLFEGMIIRSKKSIPLAIDCWSSTPSYGIHFPLCVIIVHHMEVSIPTSTDVKMLSEL